MSGHDGLGDVARELRAAVGEELRAEAEEGERLAALAALRRRDLADVACEFMARGDRVTVALPGRRFTGTVTHAAGDLLSLDVTGASVHVDLRTPLTLRRVASGVAEGRTRGGGPTSFRARLYELEMAGAEVRVAGVPLADEARGTIRAVGRDHLLLLDPGGGQHVISLAGVSHVVVER